MKKLAILISAVSLLLSSCGEGKLNIEAKKSELNDLKSQLIELKGQIKGLEKDLNGHVELSNEKRISVRIKPIQEETFYHFIEQAGKVSSKENILVSAEMGGLVTQLNATEGQWVNKGQSIIELDSDIMKSNVAELSSALELAKTTFERQQILWDQKIGSELEYLQIKNQYESLQNKFEAAEAQLKKLSISAPISGLVEELFLNPGELASPGRPAFRIVNTQKVYVEADVAERYANILKKNSPVVVNFNALGISKEAPISFVGQVINPENRTFKVKIHLDNTSGELKPNAVASLKIQDYTNNNAIVVSSQIVKRDMRGDFLFINKNGKAQKTYIQTGLSHDASTMVESGLAIGDQIIVEGYNEVVNGSLLDIKK